MTNKEYSDKCGEFHRLGSNLSYAAPGIIKKNILKHGAIMFDEEDGFSLDDGNWVTGIRSDEIVFLGGDTCKIEYLSDCDRLTVAEAVLDYVEGL